MTGRVAAPMRRTELAQQIAGIRGRGRGSCYGTRRRRLSRAALNRHLLYALYLLFAYSNLGSALMAALVAPGSTNLPSWR